MNRDEVVKRLEGAIEGCRELDARIAALAWAGAGAYHVSDGDRPSEVGTGDWLVVRRNGDRVTTHKPAEYTTSIDAALLLVPKGMGWEITFRRREHVHVAGIGTTRNPDTGRYEQFIGQAKSAALAICSAALKAGDATSE